MEQAAEPAVRFLPVEVLAVNPSQPRRVFEAQSLEELAASVRLHGILQPLLVRPVGEGWEVVAGERRLRAARMAGLAQVPCLVTRATDEESALLALVENLQRRELHFLEEAAAIAAYLRRTGASREEAAARLGLSPPALANKLRLLRLSPACAREILSAGLTERHARALLRLEDEDERLRALGHIVSGGLNVAQSELYIDRRVRALQKTPPRGRRTYILKDVRLFLNSVDRGVRLIRDAGVDAAVERRETPEGLVVTIRIPRRLPAGRDGGCGGG
jgi:ParB family chromosome partitioning protein